MSYEPSPEHPPRRPLARAAHTAPTPTEARRERDKQPLVGDLDWILMGATAALVCAGAFLTSRPDAPGPALIVAVVALLVVAAISRRSRKR